jgi:enamine deaminase RidA (YjgF/YER057c/UK114 family)
MVEIFGEKSGTGARSAVGMNSLSDGSAVEIEAIFQVRA